ncbi:MAG: hypothetical protein FWG19_00025 [Methanomassiliicoccaceae archaeon]|nr:hypothetical protein [Methanomassiliicoccaceae archaeon]
MSDPARHYGWMSEKIIEYAKTKESFTAAELTRDLGIRYSNAHAALRSLTNNGKLERRYALRVKPVFEYRITGVSD